MFHNLNFATATHIIALLVLHQDEWVSSSYIAGSVNVNPVIIRKEIKKLKDSGLLSSKEGKNGGVRLADDINKKTLADVYLSTQQDADMGKFNTPNTLCKVGRNINSYLADIYTSVSAQHLALLSQYKISDIHKFFINK